MPTIIIAEVGVGDEPDENNPDLEAHHLLGVLNLPEDCSAPDTCFLKIFNLLLADLFFHHKNTKFN